MSYTGLGFPPTIIDRIFGQNVASSVTFVVAGATLTAIAAQFIVPLYPVPVTAQSLAVLAVGMALGAVRGALAMLLYAALGAVGLPVFSDAGSGVEVLFGPAGGYIAGFVVSASVVGFLAERGWDRRFCLAIAAGTIGTMVTLAAGVIGLGMAFHRAGIESTALSLIELGVVPFLIGAFIKIVIVAAILSLSWRTVLRHTPAEQAAR